MRSLRVFLAAGLAMSLLASGCGVGVLPGASPRATFGARGADAGTLAELKRAAAPLRTVDPSGDRDELAPLLKAFAGSRLVGLGEATHGTSEFFRMKHRLVRHLVETQGFTVFAIEDGVGAAEALNAYIQRGEGDVRAILAAGMFVWNTEEMVSLVEWMRGYNRQRGGKKPLAFAGFDMQSPTYEMAYVKERIADLGPDAQSTVEKSYIFLENLFLYLLIPKANKATVLADLKAVVALIDKQRAAIERRTSPAEFRKLRHYAMNVVRAADHYLHVDPLKPMQDPAESARMFAKRDLGMAENVQYLANDAYAGQKVILWAHNGHVGNYDRYSGLDEAVTMGHHLKKAFGAGYYPLGFAFHRGQVTGIANFGQPVGTFSLAPAGPASAEAFFKASGQPRFFLDMRGLPAGGALGAYLSAEQPFRNVGYMIPQDVKEDPFTRPTRLKTAYDGLLFVEESRPSRHLGTAPALESVEERKQPLRLPALAI